MVCYNSVFLADTAALQKAAATWILNSLETRPSPSSKYYNTYAHAPYVNYAGVFFRREKAWKIFARDAWHHLRRMTLTPQRGTDDLSHVYCGRSGRTDCRTSIAYEANGQDGSRDG